MLDIKFIRENPDTVKWAAKVKGFEDHTDAIIALDKRVRELKTLTETKTAEKNKITKEIPTAKDKAALIAESKKIGEAIAADMDEQEFAKKFAGNVNDKTLPRFAQMLEAADPLIRKAAAPLIACGTARDMSPIIEKHQSPDAMVSAGAIQVLRAIGPLKLVNLTTNITRINKFHFNIPVRLHVLKSSFMKISSFVLYMYYKVIIIYF